MTADPCKPAPGSHLYTAATLGGVRCKGHNAGSKEPCGNPPMHGQEVCRIHGGSSPQARAAAQRRLDREKAVVSAARLGLTVAVDPHTALQDELNRSVGIVVSLQLALLERVTKAAAADEDDGSSDEDGLSTEAAADTGLWRAFNDQRQHLSRVAKMCVDAGIAERQVRIAEAQASLIADVLRRIFEDPDLALDPTQQEAARHVARRHLTAIGAA